MKATKARTRSAKMSARRGRPRKQGVVREPNGRASRAQDHNLEYRLMMEAATWKRRQSDPALTVNEARKPEHGSVIHAWKLASDRARSNKSAPATEPSFTSTHLETAEEIHEWHAAYRAAIASTSPRSASDFNGHGGYDGSDPFDKDRARRDKNAIAKWKEIRRAILQSGPFGMMAVETIIFENRAAMNMIGDLRLALNAVTRVLRGQLVE